MHARTLAFVAFAACLVAPAAIAKSPAAMASPAPAAEARLHYLDPAKFMAQKMVAAPPAAGSPTEALDLTRLRALIAATTPERMAQAQWDGDHEDPSLFSAALGRDLSKLPATWALLTLIGQETDVVIDQGKDFFARRRPYAVDATLPACVKDRMNKPARSYPSGHAGIGYAIGWTLAELLPEQAPLILARADDYALSREICGVHFHADTEARHVIGTLTAATLLNDRRLARQIAAARAELARH
jgi:acid phosphatase (class A)